MLKLDEFVRSISRQALAQGLFRLEVLGVRLQALGECYLLRVFMHFVEFRVSRVPCSRAAKWRVSMQSLNRTRHGHPPVGARA